jgi:hypothetical protein
MHKPAGHVGALLGLRTSSCWSLISESGWVADDLLDAAASSALAIGREYVERDTGRAKSQEKSEIAPVLYSATARSSESRHSTNESLPSSGSGEG